MEFCVISTLIIPKELAVINVLRNTKWINNDWPLMAKWATLYNKWQITLTSFGISCNNFNHDEFFWYSGGYNTWFHRNSIIIECNIAEMIFI